MDFGSLELPHFVQKKSFRTGPKEKFKDSKRFYRGRIIDALRVRSFPHDAFVEEIASVYGKGKWDLTQIVSDLIADGLITKDKTNILHLGGSTEQK